MSRLALPVKWRRLTATGDILLRAALDLLLKTNGGPPPNSLPPPAA
jgi:hypothetical protein